MLRFFILVSLVVAATSSNSSCSQTVQCPNRGSFMYFAYGSNLLKKRLGINIKSAVFITTAKLPNWRLDFNITVDYWNGAVATIAEHLGGVVWGDLWLIGIKDLEKLDKQEGVKKGMYEPVYVTVSTKDLGDILARTYVEPQRPGYADPEMLPPERQPSETYFKVILYGAMQSILPVSYLEYLERFPHNGKKAAETQLRKLGYPFWETD